MLNHLNDNISELKKRIYAYYVYLFSSVIAFIIIAILISKQETNYFDYTILLLLRNSADTSIPLGPPWLLDFFKDVTALGSVVVVVIISVLTSVFLIIKRKYLFLWIYLLTVLGGGLSDLILKEIFARKRPSIVPHLVDAENFSFPSGHAAMSVVIYISLAFILIYSQINVKLKLYIISIACFLALLVGFSRIYLGVHYPTDVLAGWSLGIFWVSLGWLLIQTYEKERLKSTKDE